MNFSVTVALAAFCFVIIQSLFSCKDKTFSRLQNRNPAIRLSFLWHWGVSVGDLLILPIFNGIVIPHIHLSICSGMLLLYAALLIALFCHKGWWPKEEKALGFIMPDWENSGRDADLWHRDMSYAGWMHFVFMVAQLVIIGGYLLSPMPKEVVQLTGVIFMIFIPVAVIEPGVVEGWPLSKGKMLLTAGVAVVLWSIVAAATWIKL